MIFLTKDYSLKMCLGEAAVTELDIVVRYRRHRSANNQGSVSWAASPDVAVTRTSDTNDVTLLAAPGANDRVDYIAYPVICNRDNIAHTMDVWVEHTGGTRHYLLDRDGVSLPAGYSLFFTEEGEPRISPEITDHGQLLGLGDDDHTIYVNKNGRSGGQTVYGGTATGNTLQLRGNSADANGGNVDLRKVLWTDNAADPAATGELARNGSGAGMARIHDGTAVRRFMLGENATPNTNGLPYFDGTIWRNGPALTAGKGYVHRGGAIAVAYAMQRATRSGGGTVTAVAVDENMAVVEVDSAAGNTTLPLPAAATAGAGFVIDVIRTDNTPSNTVTIDANGSETINGALTTILYAQFSRIRLFCTGSAWLVLNVNDFRETRVTTVDNFPGSGTFENATSLSLGPGEWDLSGFGAGSPNGATITVVLFGISTDSTGTTFSDRADGHNASGSQWNGVTNGPVAIPCLRVLLTTTTIYYFKALSIYSAGTPQYTCRMSARRVG